jgi:hypothetical protein
MSNKCKVCGKSVYPMDSQINLDGIVLHKACAKCEDCKCQITLSNFAKSAGKDNFILLCNIHHLRRFQEKGAYIGDDNFKVKSIKAARPQSIRLWADVSRSNAATPSSQSRNNPQSIFKSENIEFHSILSKSLPNNAEETEIEPLITKIEIEESLRKNSSDANSELDIIDPSVSINKENISTQSVVESIDTISKSDSVEVDEAVDDSESANNKMKPNEYSGYAAKEGKMRHFFIVEDGYLKRYESEVIEGISDHKPKLVGEPINLRGCEVYSLTKAKIQIRSPFQGKTHKLTLEVTEDSRQMWLDCINENIQYQNSIEPDDFYLEKLKRSQSPKRSVSPQRGRSKSPTPRNRSSSPMRNNSTTAVNVNVAK